MSDLRIGDADRESALAALGEHVGAGRLDLDEYADRSAKIMVAKTVSELLEIFADLPAPHPTITAQHPLPAPLPVFVDPAQVAQARKERNARVAQVAMGLVPFVVIGLFFFLHLWPLFFIIPMVGYIGRNSWGSGWNDEERRRRFEERDRRRRNKGQW
jgi:hypothetical protein